MKKVLLIFGTRPEAIKMAPLIPALRAVPGIQCEVCVTAQHRQMLDQVLDVFGIVPDADLDLMRPNQNLAVLAADTLRALDPQLEASAPDLVLVQGDTTTALVAALAAFYRRIPLGHVEAGPRSGNLEAPWPEEAHRILTTRLAALHFAPTEAAKANLLAEGVPDHRIHVTGNTVVDALCLAMKKIRAEPSGISPWLDVSGPLPGQGLPRMVLITGHRRENFGQGLDNVCRAIAHLAHAFPEVRFVFPVHRNPRVREPVRRILSRGGPDGRALPNVFLIQPQPYPDFLRLMDQSYLILTDSGGIQEEAPTLGKPVLLMRETTERPEGVAAGACRLVGTSRDSIVCGVSRLLADPDAYRAMTRIANPYGDGTAALKIAAICRDYCA